VDSFDHFRPLVSEQRPAGKKIKRENPSTSSLIGYPVDNKLKRFAFFDIDNTLIQSSSGHMQALLESIKDVYGIEVRIGAINYHGMTDQEIIVRILEKYDVDSDTILSHLKDCVECMPLKYAEIVQSENIVMLGGVSELLVKLDQNDFKLGLVTGNLEKIARAKLKKMDFSECGR
jgi:beta-phosphoglucomutase-like phosphatase (HAD superfamily)